MKRKTAVLCLSALMVLPAVSAHLPKFHSGEDTVRIEDPGSPKITLSKLDGVRAHYYRMTLQSGETLYAGLYFPERNGELDLAVSGPGIESRGDPPEYLRDMPGETAVFRTRETDPLYEPFTPSAQFSGAAYRKKVEQAGTYYIAVFGESGSKYGLATGGEQRTPSAGWWTSPFFRVRTMLWEGKSFFQIFWPALAVLAAGSSLIYRYGPEREKIPVLTGSLLYLSTAAVTSVQGMRALNATGFHRNVLLTGGMVFFSSGLSFMLFRERKNLRPSRLVLYGVLGFIGWTGYIVGPLLVTGYGVFLWVQDRS
ncbi:MAG: hypothetical protein ABEK01_02390 [Candidatus Nanohaloarchaea archaeon]